MGLSRPIPPACLSATLPVGTLEPSGLEPPTYWLQTSEPIDVSPCQKKAGAAPKGGHCTTGCTNSSETGSEPAPMPPDLAAVVAAWPTLPEPVKAGILAMVKAVS